MTQVGQINAAVRNAYEALKNTPEVDTKPKTTGLLTRTEKPKEKEDSKENDSVRLLSVNSGAIQEMINLGSMDKLKVELRLLDK